MICDKACIHFQLVPEPCYMLSPILGATGNTKEFHLDGVCLLCNQSMNSYVSCW